LTGRRYAAAVSFTLELAVEGLTTEQGRAVEAECRRRSAWPVSLVVGRRRFGLLRPCETGPSLVMPEQVDGRHLLSDDADWDAPAWRTDPELVAPLAEAIRVLGDELPQGFTLRATWVGSEARAEQVVTADELAELAERSQLNEFTRYRVPPRAQPSSE